MRNMSTPVFTSGKLRLMVPHISRCGVNLEQMLGEAARAGDILDAKEVFGKLALDAIASSSFGIESNSFKDPESLFRINVMKLTRWNLFCTTMNIACNTFVDEITSTITMASLNPLHCNIFKGNLRMIPFLPNSIES